MIAPTGGLPKPGRITAAQLDRLIAYTAHHPHSDVIPEVIPHGR